jgi:hypothetical protein
MRRYRSSYPCSHDTCPQYRCPDSYPFSRSCRNWRYRYWRNRYWRNRYWYHYWHHYWRYHRCYRCYYWHHQLWQSYYWHSSQSFPLSPSNCVWRTFCLFIVHLHQ